MTGERKTKVVCSTCNGTRALYYATQDDYSMEPCPDCVESPEDNE